MVKISKELKAFLTTFDSCKLCLLDALEQDDCCNCSQGKLDIEKANMYADKIIRLTKTVTTKETLLERINYYYEYCKHNNSPTGCNNCPHFVRPFSKCIEEFCIEYKLQAFSDFFMLDIIKLNLEKI